MKRILAYTVASVIALSTVFSTTHYNTSAIGENVSTSLYVPLKPEVLSLAKKAYNKRIKEDSTTKPYVMIVDFSYPSDKYRMFVYDMKNERILYRGLVAHGKGSGERWAKDFSNVNMSKKSSLGLYKVIYTYMGKYGYSVRLIGLEKGFNNNALSRAIVIHPAPYVSDTIALQSGKIGNSWGCFALDYSQSSSIINTLKNNGLIFAYYPDQNWIKNSKYLN